MGVWLVVAGMLLTGASMAKAGQPVRVAENRVPAIAGNPAIGSLPVNPASGMAALLTAAPKQIADTVQVERLIFCNQPERISRHGVYAEATVPAGQWTRIFFHYRNTTAATGPLIVGFLGSAGVPLAVEVRKGIADPSNDPPTVGQQAMVRYMAAETTTFYGEKGYIRFPMALRPWQVGSGVLTVRALNQDVQMRIYFGNARGTVPGMRVAQFKTPLREMDVALSDEKIQDFVRIGMPEPELRQQIDGTYGFLYAIRVRAPEGRKVRVLFSPRGGHSGLVGWWNGVMAQSRIAPVASWSVFGEATVGKDGLVLWTSPFGGVFYPVELAFHLID
ncbi:MAG: hypothetical protein OHK0029_19750 [Armatimonadaceae bacterium]